MKRSIFSYNNNIFSVVRILSGIYAVVVLFIVLLIMTAENAYPLSPDHYAENSRLASGKWAKIEVKQTEVQLITNSTLRNLGFANPER